MPDFLSRLHCPEILYTLSCAAALIYTTQSILAIVCHRDTILKLHFHVTAFNRGNPSTIQC